MQLKWHLLYGILFSVIFTMALQAMQEQQIHSIVTVPGEMLTGPKAINRFFYRLISYHAARGDFQGALDALKYGLAQGFDINCEDDEYKDNDNENESSGTLLNNVVCYAPVTFVKALLQAGADPNKSTQVTQMAPLHRAAMRSSTTAATAMVVQELVKAGADATVKDSYGYTPLVFAAKNGHTAIIPTLLTAPGYSIEHNEFKTACTLAKAFGRQEVITILKSHYATLKSLSLKYIKRHKDKFAQEQIKQLPLDLQEALQEG